MRLVVLLLLLVTAGHAPVAYAAPPGDDWGVKRNPFDPRVIGRLKAILEKNPEDRGALSRLVSLYRRHSSVGRLVAEYEREADGGKNAYQAAMVLGRLNRLLGENEAALAAMEKASRARPASASAHQARGDLYRVLGRDAEALEAYAEAERHASGKSDKLTALRAMADLSMAASDLDSARKVYERMLELAPGDADLRLELGDALSQKGLHAEALAAYRKASDVAKGDAQARLSVMTRIGRELEALGRDEEAVATYRDIIDLAGPRHYLRRELTERIVDIHRRGQDIKSLVADYDRRWPVGKRGHFEWDVMARLHEAEGDQEAALAAYAQAVASAPTELETQRRYIALLELTGRTSEALAQVEKVARIAPGDPRFQLELAERYFRAGHRSAALATLRRMTARFGGEPSVQGALAELYRRWGEEKLAIEAYERVVRIEPGDPTHLENLGEQYFQKGEKKRAVQVWKRIAAAGTPEATARLAEVYAEHDMGPEAIETYLRAIELGPGDPELLRGLATTLERQQNLDRARQVWGEILEVTAGDPGHKALRREARTRVVALLARQPGRPLLAQANRWQAAWNREPPDIEAGYSLVEAYLKLDRDEAAQTVLTRLLELRPEDADALHQLAQVRRALGELDGAIAVYRRLAELQPSREREYLNHIAGLELLLYRDDRALASARKARDKHPNDPVVHERLGEIFERTEDWNEAASAYRRVLELDHRNFEVRRKLARLYLRQGKHREAAHEYRDMLALSSSEELVAAIAPTAIDLEEYLGTLAELEAHLAPLALAHPDKPVYRRMLVRLYERLVPGLAKQARRGDEKARASLVAMGEHGLRPLLEALADQEDPDQQRIAVELIGHLGNRGATSALVRLARSDASARAEPDPGTRRMLRLRTGASHMDLRASAIRAIGFLGDPGGAARPHRADPARGKEHAHGGAVGPGPHRFVSGNRSRDARDERHAARRATHGLPVPGDDGHADQAVRRGACHRARHGR